MLAGFRHCSIPVAEATLESLGHTTGSLGIPALGAFLTWIVDGHGFAALPDQILPLISSPPGRAPDQNLGKPGH